MPRSKIKIDKQKLISLYSDGYSLTQLESILNVSRKTLSRRLKELGKLKLYFNKTLFIKDNQRFLEVIDGILLGDGFLDNGSIQITQKISNKEWLIYIKNELEKFSIHSTIFDYKSNDRAYSRLYTKYYLELKEQNKRWYLNNKKQIPNNVVITPKSVALWFCGDGSYNKRGNLNFGVCAFSKQEVELLISKLNKSFNICPTYFVTSKNYNIISISKLNDSFILGGTILPYIPDCFKYKLKYIRKPKPTGTKKFSYKDIITICNMLEKTSCAEVAKKFNVHPSTISLINSGKSYQKEKRNVGR